MTRSYIINKLNIHVIISFLYKTLGLDHNCNQCIVLLEDCHLHAVLSIRFEVGGYPDQYPLE